MPSSQRQRRQPSHPISANRTVNYSKVPHVDAEIDAQFSKQKHYPPKEFLYEHDMDKRGALFFLGTLGYQTVW